MSKALDDLIDNCAEMCAISKQIKELQEKRDKVMMQNGHHLRNLTEDERVEIAGHGVTELAELKKD